MQRSKIRPGTPRPLLSELLKRRNQTLQQFVDELGISTNNSLEMHCVLHGINKDVVFIPGWTDTLVEPVKVPEPVVEVEEKPLAVESPKKKRPKNALVSLKDDEKGPSDEG